MKKYLFMLLLSLSFNCAMGANSYNSGLSWIRKYFNSLFSSSLKSVGSGVALLSQVLPLDGRKDPKYCENNDNVVELKTLDNVKLRAKYFPPHKGKPVIIMFHGNLMTGDIWVNTKVFNWFRDLGFGVLAPTIRGYPGSEGSCQADFDKSLLLDTEAALRFLKDSKNPPERIIAFGHSLGGAYATTTAHYFRLPLILSNSWTRIGEVIGNISVVPDSAGNRVEESAITWKGRLPNLESLGKFGGLGLDVKKLVYDSGNNIRKLRAEAESKSPIDILIIYAKADDLMGGKVRAEELLHARYPERREDRLVGIEGGHNTFFTESREGKWAVGSFLKEIGYLKDERRQ